VRLRRIDELLTQGPVERALDRGDAAVGFPAAARPLPHLDPLAAALDLIDPAPTFQHGAAHVFECRAIEGRRWLLAIEPPQRFERIPHAPAAALLRDPRLALPRFQVREVERHDTRPRASHALTSCANFTRWSGSSARPRLNTCPLNWTSA